MSKLSVYLNSLQLKGNLAYEYNPFKNYLTNVNLYKVKFNGLEYIVPENLAINSNNGELLINRNGTWVDKRNNLVDKEYIINYNKEKDLYAKAGSLIDFDTEKLNFDLEHPVDIEIQSSYDGSVNLILNDNKNIPRLINSRFSVRLNNTYEIVDRIGENDTNVYNSDSFDKNTSLYFQYEKNPIISYDRYIKGILPVGLYCFYLTYCDSDDNESDYIAESGLIPVFLGNDKDPFSMDGGIKNLLSDKGIVLKINNLDKSYNYIKVYYVRYFADYQLNRVYECKKIYKKYPILSNYLFLQINGNEECEDLDPNILNISKFNPKHVLTQAQCKNMLFFGNIVKNSDNYTELTDCALRIVPNLKIENLDIINNSYKSQSGNYGYYDSKNIYNSVGYFDLEYYRFGVVFIYNNGTLSNVYNTLGGTLTQENEVLYKENTLYENENIYLLKRKYILSDDNKWITNFSDYYSGSREYVNSKGVCKIQANIKNDNLIIGIKFKIPDDVITHLKEIGIRGLFFVRQKCIPTIIAQCYLIPFDKVLQAPILKAKNTYYCERFLNDNLILDIDFENRLYKQYNSNSKSISKNAYAAICPDFLLNQPLYNLILNGNLFRLQKVSIGNSNLEKSNRFYNEQENTIYSINEGYNEVSISTVTDDVRTVALNNQIYRTVIGEAEEAFRFRFIESEPNENQLEKSNIARGIYSPYLAIYSENELDVNALYNIFSVEQMNISQEYQNRINSSDAFYAISDRYNFENITNNVIICWRGDCYINVFTYRLNRNFNDSTLPNNDEIIDNNTWENYKELKWTDISRSDINAVQLGSWVTFKVRSSTNYALRSQDHSFVAEKATMGTPRSFYPRSGLLYRGENKIPDSYLYNDAYRANLGFKCYFSLEDVNYIKNTFSNRIQYSEIAIQDSYKNNYRVSLNTYFRDYSSEYGGITKLISFEGYLLVVFEHAIGIAIINERVLVGGDKGEAVFINTSNVLPELLTIITDTYGTLWSESVIKSELGYVYGVDTVAKKIWRVKGLLIEILSDFKVNKFLINNITLSEREKTPIIGLRNVKTHYNNNKKDIMFTFYDNVFEDEEKVWNLCYNELLDKFVTFYSWVPSYSENIDTQFFTFDRNTSKAITLLSKSNYYIPENVGVLINNPILNTKKYLYYRRLPSTILYINDEGLTIEGESSIEEDDVIFYLERDHWENYKYFKIINKNKLICENLNALKQHCLKKNINIIQLNVTPICNNIRYKTETIVLILNLNFNFDFYLHGQSGIFNITENIYPTRWYGETHPFEFEFVVNDNVSYQKIFTDLVIISNKAEPESFHFEIEGDNYEFSSDKRAMYWRLEFTKSVWQKLGSNMLYDRKYTDIQTDLYTKEQYYKLGNDYPELKNGLVLLKKSTIFPLYYNRTNTYNKIYDSYLLMSGNYRDYQNLSGSEIVWNRDLNQFNIVTHIKNSPIDYVGRIRGNSRYKEGKWNVQIPSIIFNLKNESLWDLYPPLVLNYIPNDVDIKNTTYKDLKLALPNIYNIGQVSTDKWTYRKETKIRDKWIKIKVRYSGLNLAIIHSIVTLYNISYS